MNWLIFGEDLARDLVKHREKRSVVSREKKLTLQLFPDISGAGEWGAPAEGEGLVDCCKVFFGMLSENVYMNKIRHLEQIQFAGKFELPGNR